MTEIFKIGQTFPDTVSSYLQKTQRDTEERKITLEKKAVGLRIEYVKNEQLLDALGINSLLSDVASRIETITNEKAVVEKLNNTPQVIPTSRNGALSYELEGSFDGGFSIDLSWQYVKDRKRKCVLRALATGGNHLQLSASEEGNTIITSTNFDVETDGDIGDEKERILNEESKLKLNEELFRVFVIANELPDTVKDNHGELKLGKFSSAV